MTKLKKIEPNNPMSHLVREYKRDEICIEVVNTDNSGFPVDLHVKKT